MAISEFEIKRCEKEIQKFLEKRRPPVYLRNKLDFGYSIDDQSVELFEMRPQWDDPSQNIEIPFAKATYVKKEKLWKIYWQRKDLKWHTYSPTPTVKYFEEFLAIVNEDAMGCFFG